MNKFSKSTHGVQVVNQDIVSIVNDRISLLDDLIETRRLNALELAEKEKLVREELCSLRIKREKLVKFVEHSKTIQSLLGSELAEPAPSLLPSNDVPPPSSGGDGEPIEIEVNHIPTEKAKKQATSNPPKTAAEKIAESLAENPHQTVDELAEQFSVTKAYVSTICAKHSLTYKKKPTGRPSIASKKVVKALSATPDKGNRTIAREVGCSPKLVRDVRKKAGLPKPTKPVAQKNDVASTTLTTRPSSIVQQRTPPTVERSKQKVKTLFRIVERETGKHLHEDLLRMKKGPVFVEGKQFAWQGNEDQLKGCAALLGFNVKRLTANDATYGYFAKKFEV